MAIPLLIGLGIAAAAAAAAATASAVGSANAAAAQKSAAEKAMDLQKEQFDARRADALAVYKQQRADQAPWLEAGQDSLGRLRDLVSGRGFDASALASDPGFQFRMAEGQKALERSAAARGGLNSGGAMRSLARYSQGLASDEYERAYGRRYGGLAQLAGLGQSSAQNLGGLSGQYTGQQNQLAGNYANSMSGLHGAYGNAEAAGHMGVSNAIAGGFNSIGGLAMMGTGAGGGGGMQIPQQAQLGMMGGRGGYGYGYGGY